MSFRPLAQGRDGENGRGTRSPALPPEDIPAPYVSLRRIGRLFAPYRMRLGTLLAMIFIAAGLGVVNPFLIRGIIDDAYPHHDTTLLTALVAVMIALSVMTGVVGVAQTW